MDNVARLSPADRADLFTASATKRAVNVVIIEKDFWVCWALKRIFSLPTPPAGLIFKGGTSLSKVWGVIDRFSEDVDLSFDRSDLGFGGDADPAAAESTKQRDRQLKRLSAACTEMVQSRLVPALNDLFSHSLANSPGNEWRLELDSDDPQSLLFHYPASNARGSRESRDDAAYLRPYVKLEFGARGEHWPSQEAEIRPFAAEDFPKPFNSPTCRVKVVSAQRTSWEKATILHSWHHAPPGRPLRDRQSRHYFDVAKLYQSSIGQSALADLDLLRSVARHKATFFASAWARYDLAVPGTLRLVPPRYRFPELERDYGYMRNEMIFGTAPELALILSTLQHIEDAVNEVDPQVE